MDERLKAIITDYGLDKSDVWQLPQNNKTWLIKHAALEVVAVKAGVKFSPPTVLEADSANGLCAIVVTGAFGDRTEWSIGEASPKNAKNAYPWAIAEKRAKDRVILKLIGIHGLVYSEDEMPSTEAGQPALKPETEQPAPKPKAQSRDTFDRLSKKNRELASVEDFDRFWTDERVIEAYNSLPTDWRNQMAEEREEKGNALVSKPEPRTYVAPNFDEARQ